VLAILFLVSYKHVLLNITLRFANAKNSINQ